MTKEEATAAAQEIREHLDSAERDAFYSDNSISTPWTQGGGKRWVEVIAKMEALQKYIETAGK